MESGSDAEEKASEQCDAECIEKGGRVHAQNGGVWQIAADFWRNGLRNPAHAPVGEQHAERGGHQEERQVFCQKLAQQAAASSTDG